MGQASIPNGPPRAPKVTHNPETVRTQTKKAATHLLDAITNAPMTIEEGKADKEQVFLLYAGSCGDVAKTARACNLTLQEVIKLADEGDWLKRISELIDLKKLNKFDDVSRALSRATNFIQANRWRLFLERAIREFEKIPDDKLIETFTTYKVTKDGESVPTGFSLRVLADLSSALEKCHWLLYQSLLDTPADRSVRKSGEKPEETGGEADIHARIARAMSGAGIKPILAQVRETHDVIDVPPEPTSDSVK